ncbi:cysteine hydrolase family protein [Rhodococcus globerulus]|uniref:Isochorismatase family cysteine hydrolase n=1 Tax=Rhodococcus globerulus TaxID=33008 RepID=A0ABU4C685_RHOGO|nr:isochorismatase family cysteine hydrolase [Rhodococcus globerulus]MDV6271766.1 isochorismatase family cysteine hydrolase [Rhodococcus globerulus]
MTTSSISALDPDRTAILVMDLQNGILDSFPESATLLMSVGRAISDMRSIGATIVYVRVAFTPQDHLAIPAANKTFSAVAEAGVMLDGDPTTSIHSTLSPQEGDIIVRKRRFGAFSTTDLDEQLRVLGVDTLVITGISTGGVVLNTVLDAADRDYRVLILSDGVADPDPEVHKVLIEKVLPHRAHLIDSSELSALLSQPV